MKKMKRVNMAAVHVVCVVAMMGIVGAVLWVVCSLGKPAFQWTLQALGL
jgi:hypothetical protein